MKFLVIGIMAVLSAACRPETERRMDYFSGRLGFLADELVFEDCATGRRYPLGREGAYAAAEKTFREKSGTAGNVFFRFYGRLQRLPESEGGDSVTVAVVDEPIRSDGGSEHCGTFMLPGVYESRNGAERSILRLRNDYTFQKTQFTEGGEHTENGRWGRSAESELVLETFREEGPLCSRFDIFPRQESLAANGDDGPLVYVKVYL